MKDQVLKKILKAMKIIISGGGAGGHVFPAIAIADALKSEQPNIELLFVGAKGKLEMQAIPAAGYKIIGLNISGFQRKFTFNNLLLFFNLLKSLFLSFKIIRSFQPNAVVGVGGYASGPLLKMAAWLRIPIFIQEQNSYAGVTNRLLAKSAKKIFVAFEGMEKFFQKEKIVKTGNPVRKEFLKEGDRQKAREYFDLDVNKKTVGIFGGSLGARTINEAMNSVFEEIKNETEIQFLWQVGKIYWNEFNTYPISQLKNVKMLAFIDRMDYAYAACDICVTRAGAITISELLCTQTISILVPSPNVAEDHQRKNAESIVQQQAAKMILDKDSKQQLWTSIQELLFNDEEKTKIKNNLAKLAQRNAAAEIAKHIIQDCK